MIPPDQNGKEPPAVDATANLAPVPNAATTPTPPTSIPTPGLALAAARFPGGPTLPDGDPAALAATLARMANELFAPTTASPYKPDLPTATLATPTPGP